MAFTNIHPQLVRGAYVFQCGMVIDADGAATAYRADNQGLDDLKDAQDSCGHWVGVVTVNGEPFELPDGSYVSTTSLQDRTKQIIDPARYVNAVAVPYLAVCPEFLAMGVKLGDLGVAVYRDRSVAFIVADVAPHHHYGEMSIAGAVGVGLNGSPRIGGVDSGCTYIVFPGTANNPPWPRETVEFQQAAFDLFDVWGGLATVKLMQQLVG